MQPTTVKVTKKQSIKVTIPVALPCLLFSFILFISSFKYFRFYISQLSQPLRSSLSTAPQAPLNRAAGALSTAPQAQLSQLKES
jgi:hypothetical protein